VKYDPMRNPDPEAWLELGEYERIQLVEQYHRRQKIRMPSLKAHSVIHTVVENQVAMGDSYLAKGVLERLMNEGLDRHEAVHCIGSVVAGQMFAAMKGTAKTDLKPDYDWKLLRLTAKSWKESHRD